MDHPVPLLPSAVNQRFDSDQKRLDELENDFNTFIFQTTQTQLEMLNLIEDLCWAGIRSDDSFATWEGHEGHHKGYRATIERLRTDLEGLQRG